jgi:hypothetical protein
MNFKIVIYKEAACISVAGVDVSTPPSRVAVDSEAGQFENVEFLDKFAGIKSNDSATAAFIPAGNLPSVLKRQRVRKRRLKHPKAEQDAECDCRSHRSSSHIYDNRLDVRAGT